MNIAIAVLTWNRRGTLQRCLEGIQTHCSHHKVAIFEDAGVRDDTCAWLVKQSARSPVTPRPDLLANQVTLPNGTVAFLGTENLGVAGNSNRALRWFMQDNACDYLCLCNDDLVVLGDFATHYHIVYEATNIGLFCFCGFTSKQYAWQTILVAGYTIKQLGRMTGAVMAFPRALVDRIGYFDLRFGKFGEEHCDFTNRARLAEFQQIYGKPAVCLDVEHKFLQHAESASTYTGTDKIAADRTAANGVRQINYVSDGLYRPYKLRLEDRVGTDGDGIKVDALAGYYNVVTRERILCQ